MLGHLYVAPLLKTLLIQEGLSKIGPLADRTTQFHTLLSAEKQAKEAKKNLWKDFKSQEEEEVTGQQDTRDEAPENDNTQSCDKNTELQEVCYIIWASQL